LSERQSNIQIARDVFKRTMTRIRASVKRSVGANFGAWGRFVAGAYRMRVKTLTRTRSGKLSQSFKFVQRGLGKDTEGTFFTNSKYAKLHEFGGKVVPRTRKFLAIPIEGSPAMTKAGVGRYGFSLYNTLPKGYSFFFVGNARGGVLMGRKKGKRGAIAEAWYRLVRSVRIRPRLGFRTYIKDAVKDLRRHLAESTQEAIRGR
jgi:phage gpG-like protein